jgi:hypothetical protein
MTYWLSSLIHFATSPDAQAAFAQIGLASVFWPLAIRDWKRGYCHQPLFVSIPKVALLVVLADSLVRLSAPLAALVTIPDIICWLVLIGQRIVMGDGRRRGDPEDHREIAGGYWYCPECRMAIFPIDVTNDERHDPRYGGCGSCVIWETYP